MTQLTTLLENESGVQNNGVTDGEQQSDGYPIHGLIVGYFRRGRLDRSMTITNKNIRGMLGYDFQSPYYRMVQDALNEGASSVQVLRLPDVEEGDVLIPIGCAGAIDSILIGSIADGGYISVYVNDVRVEVPSGFMFRPSGIAKALLNYDVVVTPFDDEGNKIMVESEPDRFYSVARAKFKNLSDMYKRIRIEIEDANTVEENFTPENESFNFDLATQITTFCLAPQLEV